MRNASWFVMFPSKRTPEPSAVLARLDGIRGCTVKAASDVDVTIECKGGVIGIALNTQPYVVEESREAVQRHGSELANAAEVATYDARFELLYDLATIGDVFNPLLAAAERLADLTSGVVYESTNGAFQ